MIEAPKTISVPQAGKTYFNLSRNGSYLAASRGHIPTLRIGKLLRVPVRALEQMLEMHGHKLNGQSPSLAGNRNDQTNSQEP
jgi:hypothetical protein